MLRPAASGEQGADHPTLVTPEHSPFLAESLGLWRPPQDTAVLFNLTFSYVATPLPRGRVYTGSAPWDPPGCRVLGRQRQGLQGLSYHPQCHLIALPVRSKEPGSSS